MIQKLLVRSCTVYSIWVFQKEKESQLLSSSAKATVLVMEFCGKFRVFSIMEYFRSKLPFSRLRFWIKSRACTSVSTLSTTIVLLREKNIALFSKSSERFFFAFESFLNSLRRYSFNRSFWFGGSVSLLIFFRCHEVLSYIAGMNRLLAFEESNPSVPRLSVNWRKL